MTKLTYTREGQEFSCDVESLPPAALAYLLQYGWAQSLQDCIAGRAKAVREEFAENAAKGLGVPLDEATIAAAVSADILGTLAKRADAIRAGEVGVRSPVASILPGRSAGFISVAKEWLRAYAKAKGLKLPKADSDDYRALLAKYAQAMGEKIEAEAARRAATLDVDLDLAE